MNRKYIIVADDSIKGFDEEIAKLEREWGAEEIEPSEDCIRRDDVDAYIAKLMSGYLYDEERTRLEEFSAYLWELPSVTPTSEAIKEAYLKGYDYGVKDWFKSKTQPCEDCISRSNLLKEIENGIKAGNYEEGYETFAHINNMDDCVDCVRYADTIIESDGGREDEDRKSL